MTRSIEGKAPVTAMVLAAALLAASAGPVEAGSQKQVGLFLRNNKIHLRTPDGLEYKAIVNSPVYEEYAGQRAVECATLPVIRERGQILQFYRPDKGGEAGVVRVELLVSPAGDVAAIQVLEAAGPLALYTVLYAVKDWIFEPGSTAEAGPAYCRFEYRIEFVKP